MKKYIALVLTLILALSAVTALANEKITIGATSIILRTADSEEE